MADSVTANSVTAHSVATGSTGPEPTRRDFLYIATGAAAVVAAGETKQRSGKESESKKARKLSLNFHRTAPTP